VIFIAAVLVLYWLASALIPVPGFGAGVMTAEGCLSSYIDQQLIPGELYYGYGDNEGLISTLPAICTVLMGALAGLWLGRERPGSRKAAGLAAAGLACAIVGYLWGFVFPIIKIIWTSSYTLFSGGLCLMLLALFYWIIDVKGYRRWTIFFVVIGVNPITIYFLQRFVNFDSIAEFFFSGLAANAGQVSPLIIPVGVLAIKWLLLWFLYQHKIFFKV
jgi:predicted acyltransferase